jgi:diguanylate cyclase (GGDEF)-like protein
MNSPHPLPPAGHAPQPMRLRRVRLASLIYAVCVPLMIIAYWLGLVGFEAAMATIALVVIVNIALLALFHLGINLRFKDPSLTRAQVVIAILVLMSFIYAMDKERSLALILCPIVLMFGAFRFNTREFLSTSALVLAGYGVVLGLLLLTKPETVDLNVELFRWLVLACLLPCFAIIAGKVSELRQQVRRSNDNLRSALATIREMATHDSLTGLPNRALFNDSLQRAVSQAKRSGLPIALFFVDLDRFKVINDTLGHQVGDQVLMEAARRLIRCIREGDMAARLGGDEFVVLMGYEDTSMLVEVANRILAAMHQPMLAGPHQIHVSASMGICTYPANASDMHTLVSNADIAMYSAKAQGRNMFTFFSQGVDEKALVDARATSS